MAIPILNHKPILSVAAPTATPTAIPTAIPDPVVIFFLFSYEFYI